MGFIFISIVLGYLLFSLYVILKPDNVCEHDPILVLDNHIVSSYISPGKVGFSFFNHKNIYCSKCNKSLKANWCVNNEKIRS